MSPLVAVLKNNSFYIRRQGEVGEKVSISSAYNKSFFQRINSCRYVSFSDYSNEIFSHYYFRVEEIASVVDGCDKALVEGQNSFDSKIIFHIACRKLGVKTPFFESFSIFFYSLVLFTLGSVLAVVLTPFVFAYFLLSGKFSGKSALRDFSKLEGDNIYIARSKASYIKLKLMSRMNSDSECVLFDLGGYKPEEPCLNIYSLLTFKRVLIDFFSIFGLVLRDVVFFTRDCVSLLGVPGLFVWKRYILRIPHKAVFEQAYTRALCDFPYATFYTGDKEDRFAVMETRIAYRLERELICVPHGLEYGYFYPSGLCGTKFYTYTLEAKNVLSQLYKSDKFVFDEKVVSNVLLPTSPKNKISSETPCCFFTEPRDVYVNFDIISGLMAEGVDFCIKLHPLEDKEEYINRFPEVDIVESFDLAISSPICLSRKSTVLLEAALIGKFSCALLLNEKDKSYFESAFPSLNSDLITKVYSVKDFKMLLPQMLKGNEPAIK
ncbi:hypothetical protein [Halomonas mongoliensis]|uniref:hypothetical protein n=1 Tax=Halomonas mongoliensis TaxID=321265 RepID=UPI00403AAB80